MPPDLFVSHMGTRVYHSYEDGEYSDPQTYYYTTDFDDDQDNGKTFDIRDLPNYSEAPHPPYLVGKDNTPENEALWNEYHQDEKQKQHFYTLIKEAIELKYINAEGLVKKREPAPEPSLADVVKERDLLKAEVERLNEINSVMDDRRTVELNLDLLDTCDKLRLVLSRYVGESDTAMSTDYTLLEHAEKLVLKVRKTG